MKVRRKVNVHRVFNVTKEMATEYLDDLADEINHLEIGQLEKVEPGVHTGITDTTPFVSLYTTRHDSS